MITLWYHLQLKNNSLFFSMSNKKSPPAQGDIFPVSSFMLSNAGCFGIKIDMTPVFLNYFFFSPVVLMPMTWRWPLEIISVSIIFILCDVALSITHPSINYPIAKTTWNHTIFLYFLCDPFGLMYAVFNANLCQSDCRCLKALCCFGVLHS